MNTKNYTSKKAFTLVELIIVIAIIAILAVTAFLLLTKRLAKSRDASRSSNLANIENSLQISLTEKSSLPKPDSYTLIYASGTTNVVGYQGYFGEGVKDAVGNINSAPKDGDDYFTYYLNADLNKYQLASFMENEVAYNPNTVNATDYSSRYINVRGNELGMLFDATNKTPVNQMGLTGVDIMTYTGTTLQMVFSKEKTLQGTGQTLKGGFVGEGLVGYYPFDETAGTVAYDKSPYANNGTLSGVTLPIWTAGKVGNALQFTSTIVYGTTYNSSNSGGVVILNKYMGSENVLNYPVFTFSFWAKSDSDSDTGNYYSQIIKNHTSDTKTTETFSFSWNHLADSFKNATAINLGQNSSGVSNRGISKTKTILKKNTWYFITSSFDGVNLKVYLNGVLENNSMINGSPTLGNGILHIGQGGSNSNDLKTQCFRGLVDEVRIYNRALNDSEIMMLHNMSK